MESNNGSTRITETQVHVLDNLLQLSPEQVLEQMSGVMEQSFLDLIQRGMHHAPHGESASNGGTEYDEFIYRAMQQISRHIASHPAWKHPYFVELQAGRGEHKDYALLALQLYNYIQSTGQFAALSLGRIQGKMAGPGIASKQDRATDIARHLLTRLIIFEYAPEADAHSALSDEVLLNPSRSPDRYNRLLNSLQIPQQEQDITMIHGMADYILILRLLAVSSAFTELESLASVSVDAVWTAPIFLSMVLSGIIRYTMNNGITLQAEDLRGLTDYINFTRQVAPHFMLTTILNATPSGQVTGILNTTNTLLAGRYGFLTDLERQARGTRSRSLEELDPSPAFQSTDHRIETELSIARQSASENSVQSIDNYRNKKSNPFAFRE